MKSFFLSSFTSLLCTPFSQSCLSLASISLRQEFKSHLMAVAFSQLVLSMSPASSLLTCLSCFLFFSPHILPYQTNIKILGKGIHSFLLTLEMLSDIIRNGVVSSRPLMNWRTKKVDWIKFKDLGSKEAAFITAVQGYRPEEGWEWTLLL